MLVLSLFPGAGLLDLAFEQEGFCVVHARDRMFGGDHRRFHAPRGRFDGVIGGPPCQRFSQLANVVRAVHGDNALATDEIPTFERIVAEAQPASRGFRVSSVTVDNRECDRGDGIGAAQHRVRRFSFGARDGRALELERCMVESPTWEPAVCTSDVGGRRRLTFRDGAPVGRQSRTRDTWPKRSIEECCELQGSEWARRCDRCGMPIAPRMRADARYCSEACRKSAHRERDAYPDDTAARAGDGSRDALPRQLRPIPRLAEGRARDAADGYRDASPASREGEFGGGPPPTCELLAARDRGVG